MTYNGITLIQGEDGVFREYDDEYDLVLHFESEEEQKDFIDRINNKLGARPKAHWITVPGMNEQCSYCEKYFPLSSFRDRPFNINYCPNCGADMRGEVIDS